MRGAPQRGIGRGHAGDQGLDLGADRRAPPGGPAGERGQVHAEAPPRPPQHGLGGDDHEGVPPPGPLPGQPGPEKPVAPVQSGPARRPLVHGERLAQGEVLEGELAVTAAEEREEAQQVEQQVDHDTRLCADPN